MKPKHFFYGLVAILTLAIIGSSAGYVWAHRQLNQQITTLQQKTSKITLAREEQDRLQQLKTEYEETEEVIEKAEDMVPAEKQQPELVATFSKIFNQSGLTLNSISFKATSGLPSATSQTKKSDNTKALALPIQFQTSPATYKQLQTLLTLLENNQRLIQVTNLSVSSQDDGGGLIFNISAEAYVKQ